MSDDFKVSDAEVILGREPNAKTGREQECVTARCLETGQVTEAIWGTGINSVRRALATLTEECGCGARFHRDADEA
jgi:hypothetical protein